MVAESSSPDRAIAVQFRRRGQDVKVIKITVPDVASLPMTPLW